MPTQISKGIVTWQSRSRNTFACDGNYQRQATLQKTSTFEMSISALCPLSNCCLLVPGGLSEKSLAARRRQSTHRSRIPKLLGCCQNYFLFLRLLLTIRDVWRDASPLMTRRELSSKTQKKQKKQKKQCSPLILLINADTCKPGC